MVPNSSDLLLNRKYLFKRDQYLAFVLFSIKKTSPKWKSVIALLKTAQHCVVCSSSIYGFWLPVWYLQTLLHTHVSVIWTFFFWSHRVILSESTNSLEIFDQSYVQHIMTLPIKIITPVLLMFSIYIITGISVRSRYILSLVSEFVLVIRHCRYSICIDDNLYL